MKPSGSKDEIRPAYTFLPVAVREPRDVAVRNRRARNRRDNAHLLAVVGPERIIRPGVALAWTPHRIDEGMGEFRHRRELLQRRLVRGKRLTRPGRILRQGVGIELPAVRRRAAHLEPGLLDRLAESSGRKP